MGADEEGTHERLPGHVQFELSSQRWQHLSGL
jgi:hypothetical protein